ncbi:MAG: hypothetical protein HPY68_10595 [Candidatus Atribacteria bacterium]|nr:hypothetical protein [Candidatus Atribacteria bacterium]
MQFRTKINLGFAVLAILAALGEMVALFAFTRIKTSFSTVQESTPLLCYFPYERFNCSK